ncbi:MAG: hypothetical protein H6718_29045 [Polyangiaceae bacterium]|nr:hypothetical protein [Polyangiaceae bacterium]
MNPQSQSFRDLGTRAKANIDDAIGSTLAIHPTHDGAEGDTQALLVSSDAAISTVRRTLGAVIAELDGRSDLPPVLTQLADATFVARLSAGQLGAELERARQSEEHWQVVRAASKVRRGLLRALRTLDCLVCEALGVTAFTSYYDAELKEALEARRAFTHLREDSLLVRGRDTTSALRAAGMSLAKLTCRSRWLRVYDQQLVAELRARIADWLKRRAALRKAGSRSAATDKHLLDGKRLLGDYFSFVEIAHEVNKRPELIEHDGEQLRALLAVWERLDDTEVASALESVRGRSFELDELLVLAAPRDELRVEVELIAERLIGRADNQDSGAFPTATPGVGDRSSVTSISQVFAQFA